MREPVAERAPQFHHAGPAELFDIRAEGKLINLASPILDPSQRGSRRAVIANGHLRDQHRIVAERRHNRLVDRVTHARDLLAEITGAENALKPASATWIKRAKHFLAVGKIADPAAILPPLRQIIVQKFRRALVLPHPHMAIVGNDGDQPVVAHLVHMIGGR
jgi:hypothetical protein